MNVFSAVHSSSLIGPVSIQSVKATTPPGLTTRAHSRIRRALSVT